jgi:hypothetical protein
MDIYFKGKDGQIYCEATLNGRHYVYAHLNPNTGEIFYIGCGKKNRCNQLGAQRNKYWKEYKKNNGILIKIIDYNLDEKQAFKMEKEIIHAIKPVCNYVGGLAGYDEGDRKIIYAYNLNGYYFREFYTLSEANVFFNINSNDSRIIRCLNGERKSFKGYMWSSEKMDFIKPYKKENVWNIKKVYRYDLNGAFLESYEKITDFKGGCHTGISNTLDKPFTYKQSFWRSFCKDKIDVPLVIPALKESKKVMDTATGVIYESITKASKETGYTKRFLEGRFSGRVKNNTTLILI